MGRKLKSVGFPLIAMFVSNNRKEIKRLVSDEAQFEWSRNLGKSYYSLAVKEFCQRFGLTKDLKRALKVFNILHSYECIMEIYRRINLEYFENKQKVEKLDEDTLKSYRKSIFYSFIYFIHENDSKTTRDIRRRLFLNFFFHYFHFIRIGTEVNINYMDMVNALLKNRIADVKESYREVNGRVYFRLLFNGNEVVSLEGKSIKTLRKKAYRKLFFHILDSPEIFEAYRV